ncbi:MAG: serine/threonine-protein kinase [Vicinamibacterales bacterium]
MTEQVAHYNILERLGGGALGDVYRARDTKIGRTVALMQPPAHLVSDERRRARFVEDARVATTLNHPNIAALFDVIDEAGRCYLVYEFAAGPSLRQEMSGVRLGVRRAVELAAQVADALAEGHTRGIVHGDLRPDTVVVTPKGSTKILNFGMVPWTAGGAARALAAVAPDSLSSDEAVVAGYLSPEQAIGGRIDPRSDLFTLGVMLHEMLTGRNPLELARASDTVLNVTRAIATAPSSQNPDVPRELDALIARAMSKNMDARPATAAALASELRAIVSLLDARAGDRAQGTLIPLEEDRGRGPVWIAAAAVAAVGGLAWWWLR